MVYFLVNSLVFAHGRGRSPRLAREHNNDSLAHTLPYLRPDDVLFTGHARWNNYEDRRDRKRGWQHNHVPDDVPFRHVFPHQLNASVPAERRTRVAIVLHRRGLEQRYGLWEHWSSFGRHCSYFGNHACGVLCSGETVQVARRLSKYRIRKSPKILC
jgi:hypothetical protein